ncbi:hypothetical protein CONLIGDRAFT_296744 [Coniochaeta ligniaria NRRL 30616]|uniref:Uncharacterized protein n=1 Tax=Coniochaeta ligniaria NRRL 30616 TaxID=1408157 RepID=A0A1J7IV01_9PEZI|nr:hypothetical protein CONLIGDRAFT_296744 [Coniochaeta ligniaria NRRL 30616]
MLSTTDESERCGEHQRSAGDGRRPGTCHPITVPCPSNLEERAPCESNSGLRACANKRYRCKEPVRSRQRRESQSSIIRVDCNLARYLQSRPAWPATADVGKFGSKNLEWEIGRVAWPWIFPFLLTVGFWARSPSTIWFHPVNRPLLRSGSLFKSMSTESRGRLRIAGLANGASLMNDAVADILPIKDLVRLHLLTLACPPRNGAQRTFDICNLSIVAISMHVSTSAIGLSNLRQRGGDCIHGTVCRLVKEDLQRCAAAR